MRAIRPFSALPFMLPCHSVSNCDPDESCLMSKEAAVDQVSGAQRRLPVSKIQTLALLGQWKRVADCKLKFISIILVPLI